MRTGRKNSPLTENPKAGTREVRNFGLLFAALGILTGAFMVWKGNTGAWVAFSLAAAFLCTGVFLPRVLAPVYRSWMRLAAILAWLNTRLLLSVFFYLVVTPIGLVMRFMRKDLLQQRIDRTAPSYWHKRTAGETEKERYEHLF